MNAISKAEQQYLERRTKADDQLVKIYTLLCEYDAEQEKTPERYTHSGSIGHVNEQLDEIIRFLGGNQ